jgi:hypothetical protein
MGPFDRYHQAMAEQLSIFGHWERVVPAVQEEAPPPPPPPPVPIDPRQVDLLSGPQPLRAALEEACLALDAAEVRRAHQELFSRFLGQGWAARALEWADTIEWLVGRGAEVPGVDEQVARARALAEAGGAARLPEAPGYLLDGVRLAALRRAVGRLVAERGAAASLPDGRPAAYLLLAAGDADGAHSALEAACATVASVDARWLGYFGEAAWRRGQAHQALELYCRACLEDPLAVDQEQLTCQPVLDLVDLGEDLELEVPVLAFVPVLADLRGLLLLDDRALQPWPSPTLAQRLCGLLRRYRIRRAAGSLDEGARIEAKRELMRVAPRGLRELLRAI